MIHNNQRPVEASETHSKFVVNLCTILESPLHCWPLTTLFYEQKIDQGSKEVKSKKEDKIHNMFMALILLGVCLMIHGDSFVY